MAKVIIFEDHPSRAERAKDILKNAGHDVVVRITNRDAITEAIEAIADADVIVTTATLPPRALQMLLARLTESVPTIPMIALSDDGQLPLEMLCRHEGLLWEVLPVTNLTHLPHRISVWSGVKSTIDALRRENESLQREVERQTLLADTDPLTGLYNRRYLEQQLELWFHINDRYGTIFSLALIDIDNLERINTDYGRVAGDTVLRVIAQLIRKNLRRADIVARYEGDTFALLAAHTDRSGAATAAERIRNIVASTPVALDSTTVHVTVSVGVAMFPDPTISSTKELLEKADEALYRAQHRGGNRVEVYGREEALKRRILVVEDSSTEALQLTRLLERAGYEVITVEDGNEAWEKVRNECLDMVIADVEVPGMDGYQLCANIKRDARIKHIPVVLVTARDRIQDVIRGLEAGADSFLVKPFESDYLVQQVGALFQKAVSINIPESACKARHVKSEADERGEQAFQLPSIPRVCPADRQQVIELLLDVFKRLAQAQENLQRQNEELQAAKQQLAEYSRSLEERVAERTRELEEKTKELERLLKRTQELEKERIKAARLASIIQTAVTLNHEINNPLMAIIGMAEVIKDMVPSDDKEIHEKLDAITKYGERIAEVLKKLTNLVDAEVREYGNSLTMIDLERSKSNDDNTNRE
ncbi:MAG TPA: diguanylate cyclase [Armatimonadetes bacterium]|nr:diguanylate cyclase [Armatimonadota bacterium]